MSTPCLEAVSIQPSQPRIVNRLPRLDTDPMPANSRRPLVNDHSLTTLAAAGNLLLLEELLERGADPNSPQPGTGLRPLHFAASRGHLNIVSRLVEAGAAVDAVDKEGEACVFIAKMVHVKSDELRTLDSATQSGIRRTHGHCGVFGKEGACQHDASR